MISQQDNTKKDYSDHLEAYLSLQNIANRSISELLKENDSELFVYPHSLRQCKDDVDQQQILSLQSRWNGKQCTQVTVKTGNIAGFIGVNGHSLSIHSRFSPNAEEDFFLHYMLQKTLGIHIVNLTHGTADDPVFNFLLYLFPKLLNEALAQGIYKEYQRRKYNNSNLRGTIDFSRHLNRNIPFNGRIAYSTREFSHDNPVTELIRHTIDYILHTPFGRALLEQNAETRDNIAQIISATPHYAKTERNRVIKSCLKPTSHPYFSRYTPLQKLCLRILRHEKMKYGAKEEKIQGVLFDVAYLWEEYLATILTQQGFCHPNNKERTGAIFLAKNELPRYPDFYRKEAHVVADAKYKKYENNEPNREDIHQMVTYMYCLKGQRGIFVLPCDGSNDSNCYSVASYCLLGYGEECDAQLQTFRCHIPQSTHDYKQFATEMQRVEKELRYFLQPK